MRIQGFHGYNCYSSVIGELSKRENNTKVLDLINTQISFYFDKDLFWNDEWFAGSMLSPIDRLLDFDLKFFLGLEKCRLNKEYDNLNNLMELMNDKSNIFALVDFYYLNSVDWKSLEQFNIFPEHDPHYVILDKVVEDKIYYSDPYYDYRGELSFQEFLSCINGETRQGKINNQIFFMKQINCFNKFNIKELIQYRFKRYNDQKMPYNIELLGMEIDKRRLIKGTNTGEKWALNAYNCLRSIEDQYTNLSKISEINKIEFQQEFYEISTFWGLIRKKIIEYYYGRNFNLNEISYSIIKVAHRERELARKIIGSMERIEKESKNV